MRGNRISIRSGGQSFHSQRHQYHLSFLPSPTYDPYSLATLFLWPSPTCSTLSFHPFCLPFLLSLPAPFQDSLSPSTANATTTPVSPPLNSHFQSSPSPFPSSGSLGSSSRFRYPSKYPSNISPCPVTEVESFPRGILSFLTYFLNTLFAFFFLSVFPQRFSFF